ncbi:MAG: hypothetical protein MHPSP_004452, partial [Paramarteilia canceri]
SPITINSDKSYMLDEKTNKMAERFLRMVWERKISYIISLGNGSSRSGDRNDLRDLNQHNRSEMFKEFSIKFEDNEYASIELNYPFKRYFKDVYVKRTFTLSKINTGGEADYGSSRKHIKVTNFYFDSWKDDGLPNKEIFTAFINDMVNIYFM